MSEYRNYDDEWLLHSDNYCKHVSAMTSEKLHSKADIAAELAYRDELIERQQSRIEELVDALNHIAKVANSSRTQSRRDRWICLRANCAISSSDEWKTANLPKIIENSRGRELRLRAENQELSATVERLREQLSAMAEQHQCGCGHPACNRCRDDADNREVLRATPRQNLNAIKRGVAISAYMKGYIDATEICEFGCDGASTEQELLVESLPHAELYANTIYPSVKDGE